MGKVHLIMQEKLMPIMHIKPDHLPMINGSWKAVLKLRGSGTSLHDYVETANADLEAIVDVSVSVNEKLSGIEKLQKGNLLTQNDQYGEIIANVKFITKEHRQYQVDVVTFLEEMQYLYMNLLTDLQESASLVSLIDSLEVHMKKVLKLDRMQQKLNGNILKITDDLRKLGTDVTGLQESHEKWMKGSLLTGGVAGAMFYNLLALVAPPLGVPMAIISTGLGALKVGNSKLNSFLH